MVRSLIASSLMLLLSLGFTRAQSKSSLLLQEVRKELFYSTFDLEKVTKFYQKIVESGEANATFTAYQAAAKALIAKHTWNPLTKVSSLKNVEELLKSAVNEEKNNLEIRFLRFYIQNSIPSYLGFSKNLKEDGNILKKNIARLSQMNLDQGISDYIVAYINSIDLPKMEVSTPRH
ncbi:MAG: hypothetical protein AAGA64_05275 [Bacteroidota bacterium]